MLVWTCQSGYWLCFMPDDWSAWTQWCWHHLTNALFAFRQVVCLHFVSTKTKLILCKLLFLKWKTSYNNEIDNYVYVVIMCRCSKCDGFINCPWLTPHDEANCSQCPSDRHRQTYSCDCNKPGKFTCEGYGRTCYNDAGKIFVYLFN